MTSIFELSSHLKTIPSRLAGRIHLDHWHPVESGSGGGTIIRTLSFRRTTPITLTVLPSFIYLNKDLGEEKPNWGQHAWQGLKSNNIYINQSRHLDMIEHVVCYLIKELKQKKYSRFIEVELNHTLLSIALFGHHWIDFSLPAIWQIQVTCPYLIDQYPQR